LFWMLAASTAQRERALAVCADVCVCVCVDVSFSPRLSLSQMTHKLPKAAPGEDPGRAICAIDASPGSDSVVVGTSQSRVMEIDGSGVCTPLVAGHSADLYQVSPHQINASAIRQ
jgi:hypothetical protein